MRLVLGILGAAVLAALIARVAPATVRAQAPAGATFVTGSATIQTPALHGGTVASPAPVGSLIEARVGSFAGPVCASTVVNGPFGRFGVGSGPGATAFVIPPSCGLPIYPTLTPPGGTPRPLVTGPLFLTGTYGYFILAFN